MVDAPSKEGWLPVARDLFRDRGLPQPPSLDGLRHIESSVAADGRTGVSWFPVLVI